MVKLWCNVDYKLCESKIVPTVFLAHKQELGTKVFTNSE